MCSYDETHYLDGCGLIAGCADPDMLQVGRLGCPESTHGCPVKPELLNWTKAHFAAFAIVSSPLVLSIVPTDETLAPILDIIGCATTTPSSRRRCLSSAVWLFNSTVRSSDQRETFACACDRNKQAMAINQAWHGHPGTLVATLPPTPPACPACAEPGTAIVGVPCDATDKTQQGWAFDAAAGHITHGGLCVSAQEWGIPLNLYTCGNTTTHQNFTYDAKAKHFQTEAPANGKGMYPALLEISSGPGMQKAYVYRPGTSSAMEFTVDSGSIKNADDQCLAARGEYMPPAAGVAGLQIWAKPLGAGKTAVLFINGGGSPYSASISLKALNITTASVRAPLGPTAALAPGGSFPFLQASCHSDCAISLIVCRSLRLLAGLS